MKHHLIYSLLILLLTASPQISAQTRIGFVLPYGAKSVQIPFELYSNLIAIPITINGNVTLKFILDSGSENAILTEKLFGDIMDLNYVRTIHVAGAGVEDSISAFVASNISMSLPGGVTARGLNMLVLEKDYLELKHNLGDDIYGIIGYDIFSRFVVDINYDDLMITLYDPKAYKPRGSYQKVPIEIDQTKPFVNSLIVQKSRVDSIKMLIDTGASHALLLDINNTEDLKMPKKTIDVRLGQGLGGEIPGHLGRMDAYWIDQFCFEDILISIPIEGAYMKAIKRGSRHGTIGGDVLRRFNVVFNYPDRSLYLKKNGQYKDPFEFDMSGLTLLAQGDGSDTLLVRQVRKDTPAQYADIQVGDIILKINGRHFNETSLSDIHSLLRKRSGLKVKLVILRENRKLKKTFRLKKMI